MTGRRPIPTALKIATGNPGKRAINRGDAKIKAGIPQPPDDVPDDVRRAWFTLCPLLFSMGVLTPADAIALERLCYCYAEVRQLEAEIAEKGRNQEVETNSGDVMERQRPAVAQLADADRRLKSYLVEFGLTPAARSKVNVSEPEKPSNATNYFGSD